MNINFTAEELAFRDEVRAFFTEKLPKDIAAKVKGGRKLSKEDHQRWQRILSAQGWYAPHWPVQHGGTDWTAVQKHIFEEEAAAFGAPRTIPFSSDLVAPVIIKFGNEEQKQKYLPRILSGEDWWCQGYSEPGAGSDLASLKTRAVREGDHYIINGQKTWTTLGQYANMIFCLVRTSSAGKPQEGISFLLVDMDSPGIDIRPIITLDGEHEVNEVFFSDVRVPAANLVGEENRGWSCAKYLLTYERTNIAGVGLSTAALQRLKLIAAYCHKNGRPLAEDPAFAARLAHLEIELDNMRTTSLRVIANVAAGGSPGEKSSMLKIRGTELRQQISALTRRAMGPYARPFQLDLQGVDNHGSESAAIGPDGADVAATEYFNLRKLSIFGGSNEIQKNIISKMILGL